MKAIWHQRGVTNRPVHQLEQAMGQGGLYVQFLPTKPTKCKNLYSFLQDVTCGKLPGGHPIQASHRTSDKYPHRRPRPPAPSPIVFQSSHYSIAFQYFRKKEAISERCFIPTHRLLQSFFPNSVVDQPLRARHTAPGACDAVVNQPTETPILPSLHVRFPLLHWGWKGRERKKR